MVADPDCVGDVADVDVSVFSADIDDGVSIAVAVNEGAMSDVVVVVTVSATDSVVAVDAAAKNEGTSGAAAVVVPVVSSGCRSLDPF